MAATRLPQIVYVMVIAHAHTHTQTQIHTYIQLKGKLTFLSSSQ